MPALRDIGEFAAIARLARARQAAAPRPAPALAGSVVVGSGDDAAVLRPAGGRDLVVTTDAFVEDRHYVAAALPARGIGARLAAANLSDLAAMAALPRWALFSAGIRPEHDVDSLVELQAGLVETLGAEGAEVVGGNLVAVEGAEWLGLTLLGETPPDRAWTRRGARPGDLLAVTGAPGRAGAGVLVHRRLGARAGADEWKPLLDAWLAPRPRTGLALALAGSGAVTAAIDVSDGFAADLGHLCEAGAVGADIDEAAWPADPLLERAARALGVEHERLRFGPSDDYELLLAVNPARREACAEIARAANVPLAFVGRVTGDRGALALVGAGGTRRRLPAVGYEHFGGS